MTKFKITLITSEGVRGKECNPYGEKTPEDSRFMADMVHVKNVIQWQEAEYQLQEYPLTEKSRQKVFRKAMYHPESGGKTFGEMAINQLIEGEIVIEGGKKKIKVV